MRNNTLADFTTEYITSLLGKPLPKVSAQRKSIYFRKAPMGAVFKKLKEKKKIGEVLLARGWVTAAKFSAALSHAKENKIRIGEALISLGLIDEAQMAESLAEQYDLKFLDLDDIVIQPSTLAMVPDIIAKQHHVLPIDEKDGQLVLALDDPINLYHISTIQNLLAKEIVPVLARRSQLLDKIDQYYRQNTRNIQNLSEQVKKNLTSQRLHSRPIQTPPESEDFNLTDESSVKKLVETILLKGIRSRASDIHLEPFTERVLIRQRIDGNLYEMGHLETDVYASFVSRLKVMSGMDISEKRKTQDGGFNSNFSDQHVDFRVSTLPTIHGEKVVIRILNQTAQDLSLSKLGYGPQEMAKVEQILKRPHGIILVTGPTGSGKTTSIYSMLKHLDEKRNNIVTIEDPVELQLSDINQVQVNVKAGMTFAQTLRGVLRQDPDIIMVGEIRDAETAEIAIRAALTGHQVISTLHTNDALGTIHRLIDIGIPVYLIASALSGIIAQRLVRKLCKSCRRLRLISEEERVQYAHLNLPAKLEIYDPCGCASCNQSGYYGRSAICEILLINDTTKKLIAKNSDPKDVKEAMQKGYLTTLQQSVYQLLLQGETSLEETLHAFG